MMNAPGTLLTIGIALLLLTVTMTPYLWRHFKAERKALRKMGQVAGTEQAVATSLHPQIDMMACIGCGSCVAACPEDGVLGLVDGKAALIHASKCVGHGLCVEACPVNGIRLAMASPGRSVELPEIDEDLETNLRGIYIAGELGGIGLIRNAIRQGVQAIEGIARMQAGRQANGRFDVVIVGAGPAGLAAGLAAKERGMRFVILDQSDIGGTILQYPRRKIVLTAPVDLPLYGRLNLRETRKESLLELWEKILARTQLAIRTEEKVLDVRRAADHFVVVTGRQEYPASNVILALGRRGTPRKLGVPGENLSKVVYRLIEAETYQDQDLLVVGGGDSAVEAAVALASQKSNRVHLSYRKAEFGRIKDRNQKRLSEMTARGRINLLLSSNVLEIGEKSVVLEAPDGKHEIPNNYVFIFAGGELPYDFLRKIGIEIRSRSG